MHFVSRKSLLKVYSLAKVYFNCNAHIFFVPRSSKWKFSSNQILYEIDWIYQIIKEIENSIILYIWMEPPNNFKGHPTIADPQSPTQIASTLLEKKM